MAEHRAHAQRGLRAGLGAELEGRSATVDADVAGAASDVAGGRQGELTTGSVAVEGYADTVCEGGLTVDGDVGINAHGVRDGLEVGVAADQRGRDEGIAA